LSFIGMGNFFFLIKFPHYTEHRDGYNPFLAEILFPDMPCPEAEKRLKKLVLLFRVLTGVL